MTLVKLFVELTKRKITQGDRPCFLVESQDYVDARTEMYALRELRGEPMLFDTSSDGRYGFLCMGWIVAPKESVNGQT